MFQLDALIGTSVLPLNVMSLRDDDFINFVKQEAGDAAAELLEIQGINCVKSLLMTTNIYSIMDIKSINLEKFKRKFGYLQDDETYVIQPGIKGSMDYLMDLLKQKILDDRKSSTLSKRNQSLSSTNKTTDTLSIAANLTSSSSSSSSDGSSKTNTSKSFNSSTLEKHKVYIIETVNAWCERNKSQFNLEQFSLIEGQDFLITIQKDSSNALKGYIKCCCGKWLSLTLRRNKFQISNFYRHLQDYRSGNMCKTMNKMINNSQSN